MCYDGEKLQKRDRIMKAYIFREAEKQEIPLIFDLIMRRVAWMDVVVIHQWNDTKYAERYPLDYYEMRRQKGELFVLAEQTTGDIVCVGALFHDDVRWPDPESAYYLHHFASDPDHKGIGSLFLQEAEAYTKAQGKLYMRLDSAIGNAVLEEYYASRGYEAAGYCQDGLYKGVLRQKSLI
jgi:GNAT superfamily N-acetyltransferase